MMDYFFSWCIDEAAIPKTKNKNTCFSFCYPQTYVFLRYFYKFPQSNKCLIFLYWISRTSVRNTCFDADMQYYNEYLFLKNIVKIFKKTVDNHPKR